MTEFEYELREGFYICWSLNVSGYHDINYMDGDFNTHDTLVDVEATMENCEREYEEHSCATLLRVRGGNGWREFEWDNGATHRYEWQLHEIDTRCPGCLSPDNDLYMVTDRLWKSSGLTSRECFRCLEKAIGRELTPNDFKPDLPANDGDHHGAELRQRMGYDAA